MKRVNMIGLVVIITIISVFAMVTIPEPDMQEQPAFIEDEVEESGKPEGTGYMFDDYDKNINIPFEKKDDDVKTDEDNESSQIEDSRFKSAYEKNMIAIDDGTITIKPFSKPNRFVNEGNDIRSKSKTIISKVQNNISFEEKLYLVKVVSRLNLSEINDIRNAIMNGTTNAESIKLWTMLRNKLPHDEYKKLENIIVKYE